MNCLTRFHWATEAIEKTLLYFLLSHSFMSFYTPNCYLVKFFQTFKSNLTTNRPSQTSVIIPGYKVSLTKIILAVLFGISDVKSDIFEGPWPYEK